MKDFSKMLKDEDLARIFRVKPQTIRVWRLRGTSPSYHTIGGRSVRYDPVEVEAYLQSRQRQKTKRKEK